MSNSTACAFPTGVDGDPGLTKRELFAAMAMHAEFLSCGSLEGPAAALAEAAEAAGQTPVQRMAINAIEVADALLAELAK
jgi:hypothetical protein